MAGAANPPLLFWLVDGGPDIRRWPVVVLVGHGQLQQPRYTGFLPTLNHLNDSTVQPIGHLLLEMMIRGEMVWMVALKALKMSNSPSS
jgi:hypothetical protein